EVAPVGAEPRARGLELDLDAELAELGADLRDVRRQPRDRLLDVAVEVDLGQVADEAERAPEQAAGAVAADVGVGDLAIAAAEDRVVDALALGPAARPRVARDDAAEVDRVEGAAEADVHLPRLVVDVDRLLPLGEHVDGARLEVVLEPDAPVLDVVGAVEDGDVEDAGGDVDLAGHLEVGDRAAERELDQTLDALHDVVVDPEGR